MIRRCRRFSAQVRNTRYTCQHNKGDVGLSGRTFKQIPRISLDLYPHHTWRMRLQSSPRFIEHTEPLGVFGDRFGIGRG